MSKYFARFDINGGDVVISYTADTPRDFLSYLKSIKWPIPIKDMILNSQTVCYKKTEGKCDCIVCETGPVYYGIL